MITPDYMLDANLASDSIVPYVLLANAPQALVSTLYLTYNGIFTAMLANREWSNYARKRATLRVTSPSPIQQSTYFLFLPFTFNIPLIVASIILHWLILQSLFVARIVIYKNGEVQGPGEVNGNSGQDSGSNLRFSDFALIATIVWSCILVAFCLLVAGLSSCPTELPIGGTNSAVISAACHVRDTHGEEAREEYDQSEVGIEKGAEEETVNRPLQ